MNKEKKEKFDGLLHGVSSILESLGELAEKGQRLKQAVHEAEKPSARDKGSLQPLATQIEETDSGWKLTILTSSLAEAKVDIKVKDDVLNIKIVKDQDVEYKDVELAPGSHIDSVHLGNDTGCIEIHYS